MQHFTERSTALAASSAGLAFATSMGELARVSGKFKATMFAPNERERAAYIRVRDKIAEIQARGVLAVIANESKFAQLRKELEQFELVKVWEDEYDNVVTDEGARYLLDNGLGGSAYTAAFYLGLIDASGFTAVAAGNTMASHAGWTETSAYSQAARPTAAWSAAATRTKSFSAALTYSMNATVTVKGSFLTTNSTKSGTTGVLYSAGAFSGGDQPAVNGNTLTVSYSASV